MVLMTDCAGLKCRRGATGSDCVRWERFTGGVSEYMQYMVVEIPSRSVQGDKQRIMDAKPYGEAEFKDLGKHQC